MRFFILFCKINLFDKICLSDSFEFFISYYHELIRLTNVFYLVKALTGSICHTKFPFKIMRINSAIRLLIIIITYYRILNSLSVVEVFAKNMSFNLSGVLTTKGLTSKVSSEFGFDFQLFSALSWRLSVEFVKAESVSAE